MHQSVPKTVYFEKDLEEFFVCTKHEKTAIKGTLRTMSFSGKLSFLSWNKKVKFTINWPLLSVSPSSDMLSLLSQLEPRELATLSLSAFFWRGSRSLLHSPELDLRLL